LRRRLQRTIDRRFFRSKYDAHKTLAAFSATLRQEVSLPELQERLVGVVNQTMQPTHVSLWLRPAPPAGAQEMSEGGSQSQAHPPLHQRSSPANETKRACRNCMGGASSSSPESAGLSCPLSRASSSWPAVRCIVHYCKRLALGQPQRALTSNSL